MSLHVRNALCCSVSPVKDFQSPEALSNYPTEKHAYLLHDI